jgi:hypothetical protein
MSIYGSKLVLKKSKSFKNIHTELSNQSVFVETKFNENSESDEDFYGNYYSLDSQTQSGTFNEGIMTYRNGSSKKLHISSRRFVTVKKWADEHRLPYEEVILSTWKEKRKNISAC